MTNFVRTIDRFDIAAELGVQALKTDADFKESIEKRIAFIKNLMIQSNTRSLVLGISGGVDSTTAALLCQRAVSELRAEGRAAEFIAIRLPFKVQQDESDAQLALECIKPDKILTINIADAVEGMMAGIEIECIEQNEGLTDFVKGNVKARQRMIAQYAVANYTTGLVVGTDHAAEGVMGFFTKFGDGACDLTPLAGLVKCQVRKIAAILGAPAQLVDKTPTADLEELDPGKPDEVAYGCTYEQIDAFLLGEDVDDEVANRIIQVYIKTAHKRALPYAPE